MDGHGLNGRDAYGSLDLTETVKLELIDRRQSVRILPVVLHYIDVVGDREQAGICRGLRVP